MASYYSIKLILKWQSYDLLLVLFTIMMSAWAFNYLLFEHWGMCIFVTNILFLIFRMASVFITIIYGILCVILDLPVERDRAAVQIGLPDARINFRATLQRIQRLIRVPFLPFAMVNRNMRRPVRDALRRNGWTPVSRFRTRRYMRNHPYQRIQIGIALTIC